MQYPIIDLISDAYLKNGWTGFENKNRMVEIEQSTVSETAAIGSKYETMKLSGYSNRCRTKYLIPINGTITISGQNIQIAILQFDQNMSYLGSSTFISWKSLPTTQSLNSNCNYIALLFRTSSNAPIDPEQVANSNVQVEIGESATAYIKPVDISKEFAVRLKLPLPDYFPHPVIDALQHAAAGTQTADDTEILRHYLTPLGIGGI